MARLKLSAAQALQLIQQLGVDAELVADDQAVKDLKFDEAIAAVDESRSKIIRPDLEAELRSELTTSIAGKFGGELRTHLRRLSGNVLKTSDLKELKDEEALQKFLEVMVGQKDQSLEDIRTQMRTALEEAEADKVKALSEKDAAFNALKSQYTNKEIVSLLMNDLKGVPLTGGDLEVLSDIAKDYVGKRYHIHYDEGKKRIELRDLTNPEKPALNGQVAVQVKDVLTDFAKSTGILKTDMRNEDPRKHLDGNQGGEKGSGINFSAPGDFDKDLQAFESMLQ